MVCVIANRAIPNPATGSIEMIGNFGGEKPESKKTYEFVDPEINGISPSFGPKSGGTLVQIYGKHLDAGWNASVALGFRICDELKRSVYFARG